MNKFNSSSEIKKKKVYLTYKEKSKTIVYTGNRFYFIFI